MKFLLVVLAIHFAAKMIAGERKNEHNDEEAENDSVRHPAEFNIR